LSIKVPVSTQEAKLLAGVAKRRGMTRGDMCRNLLIEALTGSQNTLQDMEALQETQKELEDAQKALQESQKELEDAQKALQETRNDLEALQGQVKDLQGVHDELLALRISHAKLEGQVKDLQGVHDELLALRISYAKLEGQAEELKAAKVHTEGVLQEIISKIPQAPMLTDGQNKASWWDRFRGRG
jgi:predicted nuclease with TOPRIM domain